MQFLLLLSALLSAVTGAFAGPRAVEAQVSRSEAQVVAAANPAARVQAQATRPVEPCPKRVVRPERLLPVTPALPVALPLKSICLIE